MSDHQYNNKYDMNFIINILITIVLLIATIILTFWKSIFGVNRKCLKSRPPSPLCLPIVGHMYLMAKHNDNPWRGFNELRGKYGNIVGLKLGQIKAVLISSADLMREVLLVKGDIFCDRPSFFRYSLIFGRDKNNALALCDWSDIQKFRRSMAQLGLIPKFGSHFYRQLAKCIESEIQLKIVGLLDESHSKKTNSNTVVINLTKRDVLIMCANIFIKYLCTKKPSSDCKKFLAAVDDYDYIFYDVNQCYAIDFLPFLSVLGLHRQYLNSVEQSALSLRNYVEKELIADRLVDTIDRLESRGSSAASGSVVNNDDDDDEDNTDTDNCPTDFLELMLEHYVENPSSAMSWPIMLYEMGDLVGGHSAVGNLLMRLLGWVALNERVQQELYEEAVRALAKQPNDDRLIRLDHRPLMPVTEASILETLRLTSSPIVPHVNREDTTLQGYDIEKGTMVLFNTYYLNMSDKYWSEPQEFRPQRFVSKSYGNASHISKPDHFFPFSSGRRSCLGYKMVQTIAFAALANLVLNFQLTPATESTTGAAADSGADKIRSQLAPKGCLALDLSDNCFQVALSPRPTTTTTTTNTTTSLS
ncbi:cytochrome P450 307a1-like [Oppia nitens]|uniref:cytochrome P450 307a1-like n=1 Tax=Oppia nitens TaxID=1686743 RepID=UPI0023DC71F8|nr:cytochrome P450 307a1-like [Oppia nitens]